MVVRRLYHFGIDQIDVMVVWVGCLVPGERGDQTRDWFARSIEIKERIISLRR